MSRIIPKENVLFYQLTTVAALEGIHAYSVFLPSLSEVRTDRDKINSDTHIRQGEVLASLVVLALASTVSGIVDSPAPILITVLVGGLMVGAYEYALRTRG